MTDWPSLEHEIPLALHADDPRWHVYEVAGARVRGLRVGDFAVRPVPTFVYQGHEYGWILDHLPTRSCFMFGSSGALALLVAECAAVDLDGKRKLKTLNALASSLRYDEWIRFLERGVSRADWLTARAWRRLEADSPF